MVCGLRHERALRKLGVRVIAGVDEAGRGPLAGPVVVAAVILPERFRHATLKDSKKLTPLARERIYDELICNLDVFWAVEKADVEEIDRINIVRATHEAMRRATLALPVQPDHVLIDGLPVRPFPIASTAIVEGDGKSLSIAAASVIAKVIRDRLMTKLDDEYPAYGFARHKGYATEIHLQTLRTHGPCPIHRRSFLPVSQAVLSL